jgi:hypothetical protein
MAHVDPNTRAAPAGDVDVDAAIDAAVKAKLAELGINLPEAPEVKPTALERLGSLAGEIEDSTFVQRLETLAAEGYQAAVGGEPAVKALVSVVGELVEKI